MNAGRPVKILLAARGAGVAAIAAATIVAIVTGCATTVPDSVRVNLVEVSVKLDDKALVPELTSRVTTAKLDINDGTRVRELTQLTTNTDRAVQIMAPAMSPNQDAMVYVELAGGNTSVYRQSLGSPAQSPIAPGRGINLSPTFTPEGRFIVFSSDRSGEHQSLWRQRSDGAGGTTQITSSSSFDWRPAVAADGETIVFQSHRSNNVEPSIWSINMNGGLLTQLADGHSPAVSPDGRRIVFVRPDSASSKNQIWSMQIDGSGLTQLTSNASNNIDPSWHPNGRFIVFASDATPAGDEFADYNIWIMRADGSQSSQLTENASRDDAPVFERRGQRIVFRSNRGGQWNLFSFKPQL
jgi:Tol biopolymer transport system component